MSSKTLPRSLQRASGATAHWNFNPTASLSPKSHSLRSAHHPRFFCNSKLQLGFDVHAPNTPNAFSHQFSTFGYCVMTALHCACDDAPQNSLPSTDSFLILLLSSSSPSCLSSRFSPLPSRRYLVFFSCPMPVSAALFPHIYPAGEQKRVKHAILFLLFLFL